MQRREPLPRLAGWAVFGVLVIFTAAGIARAFQTMRCSTPSPERP